MPESRPTVRLATGIAAITAVILVTPAGATGQVCSFPDTLAALLPDTIPAPGPYATIRDQGVPFAELDLGIGHLRPTDSTQRWNWLTRIAFPLSHAPGAEPWGWIAGGWEIDAGTGHVEPFPYSVLLETGYEEATFIVLESADDGWTRIRFAPPGAEPASGTAWVPDCALNGETVDLTVEPWEDRLLSDEISPLFFRSEVPHILREAPGPDGRQLGVIAGDYHLEPQEVAGDWMRVIVKQPSDYCAWDLQPEVQTGWVRWRSPDKGPWVWYHTRGC